MNETMTMPSRAEARRMTAARRACLEPRDAARGAFVDPQALLFSFDLDVPPQRPRRVAAALAAALPMMISLGSTDVAAATPAYVPADYEVLAEECERWDGLS